MAQEQSDSQSVSSASDAPSSLRSKSYRVIDTKRYHPYRRWEPPMEIENLMDSIRKGEAASIEVSENTTSNGQILIFQKQKQRNGDPPAPEELEARLHALRMDEHRRRIRRLANVMVDFVHGLTRALRA